MGWDLASDTCRGCTLFHVTGLPCRDEAETLADCLEHYIHPDDRDMFRLHMDAQRITGAPPFDIEVRMRHADGSRRWIRRRKVKLSSGTAQDVRCGLSARTPTSPHTRRTKSPSRRSTRNLKMPKASPMSVGGMVPDHGRVALLRRIAAHPRAQQGARQRTRTGSSISSQKIGERIQRAQEAAFDSGSSMRVCHPPIRQW